MQTNNNRWRWKRKNQALMFQPSNSLIRVKKKKKGTNETQASLMRKKKPNGETLSPRSTATFISPDPAHSSVCDGLLTHHRYHPLLYHLIHVDCMYLSSFGVVFLSFSFC